MSFILHSALSWMKISGFIIIYFFFGWDYKSYISYTFQNLNIVIDKEKCVIGLNICIGYPDLVWGVHKN